MDAKVRAVIDQFQLAPHPEGGHFREIYRSAVTVQPRDHRPMRSAVTSIFFLLAAGEHSRWHRVLSDEIWHFYAGDPLELYAAPASLETVERVTLGGVGSAGRLVHTVPAGWWQAARPTGAYSLVGCTVAPGFEFADFSFLRDDPARADALERLDPALHPLI